MKGECWRQGWQWQGEASKCDPPNRKWHAETPLSKNNTAAAAVWQEKEPQHAPSTGSKAQL